MNRMHRGAIVGVCAAAITLTACSGGGSTPEDADGSAAESSGRSGDGVDGHGSSWVGGGMSESCPVIMHLLFVQCNV